MSKKLFVGNMPYSMKTEELVALFEPYGQADEVRIIMDRMTGRSKGFGFVTLTDDSMADKAIAELNGKDMGDGLTLKVDMAKPPSNDRSGRNFGSRNRGNGGY